MKLSESARVSRRASALMGLVALAGCSTREADPPPDRSSVPSGAWVWETVNDQVPPVEFPAGSGATLTAGTLEILPAEGDSATGRFALRFDMRLAGGDVETSGVEGRFVSFADSLHFIPDQAEATRPVRFRFASRPDGALELMDASGNVWIYRERMSR